MPRVDIDTDLFDQDETIHLGALLGDDDAWRYLVKLWAWDLTRGVTQSVTQGMLRVSRERLAEIVGFRRGPDLFFESMVKSGWLTDVQEIDGCVQYRMRGFASRCTINKRMKKDGVR